MYATSGHLAALRMLFSATVETKYEQNNNPARVYVLEFSTEVTNNELRTHPVLERQKSRNAASATNSAHADADYPFRLELIKILQGEELGYQQRIAMCEAARALPDRGANLIEFLTSSVCKLGI